MADHEVKYGSSTIGFGLTYAERKTLGIKVFPDKSVQAIAPFGTPEEEVKEKVRSKAQWIIKQQEFFLSFHPLTPPRKYISGETHLYLGRQYKLKVREGNVEEVKMHGGFLEVFTKDKKNADQIERLIKSWYKEKADTHFNQLYEKNIKLTSTFKKKPISLKYRWMTKRWGSCDKNGGIHLNLELIKAPKKCIEYVLVHELCHLEHHDHSKAFYKLLERLYPEWRETKDRLERFMV